MKFVDLVNSVRDPLMLLKYALYTKEMLTTTAKKKRKKKRKTQNVNAQNMNPNRKYIAWFFSQNVVFFCRTSQFNHKIGRLILEQKVAIQVGHLMD